MWGGGEIDQNIDIALRPGLIPGRRPEECNGRHMVSARQFVTPALKDREGFVSSHERIPVYMMQRGLCHIKGSAHGTPVFFWCRRTESNRHAPRGRGILSPLYVRFSKNRLNPTSIRRSVFFSTMVAIQPRDSRNFSSMFLRDISAGLTERQLPAASYRNAAGLRSQRV